MTSTRRFSPTLIATLSLVFAFSALVFAKEKNDSFPGSRSAISVSWMSAFIAAPGQSQRISKVLPRWGSTPSLI